MLNVTETGISSGGVGLFGSGATLPFYALDTFHYPVNENAALGKDNTANRNDYFILLQKIGKTKLKLLVSISENRWFRVR